MEECLDGRWKSVLMEDERVSGWKIVLMEECLLPMPDGAESIAIASTWPPLGTGGTAEQEETALFDNDTEREYLVISKINIFSQTFI